MADQIIHGRVVRLELIVPDAHSRPTSKVPV